MTQPLIFINTYKIKPGKEGAYLEKFEEIAALVEAKEPRMLYFAAGLSEDGSEATAVQVHADADNMAHHLEVVGDHIRESAEFLDFSTMTIQLFGSPTEAVLEQLRQAAGSGVPVTISREARGFNRFDRL